MRISDWSSDVCASDLPCSRVGMAAQNSAKNRNIIEADATLTLLRCKLCSSCLEILQVSITFAVKHRYFHFFLLDFLHNLDFPLFNISLRFQRFFSNRCLHVFRSEEHTSELQSLMRISYAVFCLNKKKIYNKYTN